MKTENIDFTTACTCAMCGRGCDSKSGVVHTLDSFKNYTNCKILLCKDCAEVNKSSKNDLFNISEFFKNLTNRANDLNTQFAKLYKEQPALRQFANGISKLSVEKNPTIEQWINTRDDAFVQMLILSKVFEPAYCSNEKNKKKDEPVKKTFFDKYYLYTDGCVTGFYLCPVCGGTINCTTKPEEIDPSKPLSFECENHCFWFDTEMLKRMYGYRANYETAYRGTMSGNYQHRNVGIQRFLGYAGKYDIKANNPLCETLEYRCIMLATADLAEKNIPYAKLIERLLKNNFAENAKCDYITTEYHKDSKNFPFKPACLNNPKHGPNWSYGGCNDCLDYFVRNNKDINKQIDDFRASVNQERGWKIGANVPFEDLINYADKRKNARHSCKYFCELTPDGELDLCGRSHSHCEFCFERSDCRLCSKFKEGKPSDWYALNSMCEFNKNGTCTCESRLKCCKESDWWNPKKCSSESELCAWFKIKPEHEPK